MPKKVPYLLPNFSLGYDYIIVNWEIPDWLIENELPDQIDFRVPLCLSATVSVLQAAWDTIRNWVLWTHSRDFEHCV